MQKCFGLGALFLILLASAGIAGAAITTFDYTQTDSLAGSGTIAAPAQSIVGGVTITWSQTAMPQASVRDPSGAGSPGGAVGGFSSQEGNNGGNGRDVAIYWNTSPLSTSGASTAEPVSVDILGSGSDGNSYSVRVPLVFFGDNVLPDENFPGWGNNDFRWSLEYGDILGTNPEGSPRTAMWLSPTFALTEGGRSQRYTQDTNALDGVLTNTDLTKGSEKDAFDQNGNTTQTAAIGQPLEFGFGWRDKSSVTGGPVLVDNFNVQGLLEFDEANIALVQNIPFTATSSVIFPGAITELTWLVDTTATSIVLTQDPGNDIGDVAGDTDLATGIGSREVSPGVTTTYTLEVITPEGTETAETTVEVARILSFTTDSEVIGNGNSVTLSWHVRDDVTGVSISPDPGPLTTVDGMGSIVVVPVEGTTTYTLSVTAPGEADQTASVEVFTTALLTTFNYTQTDSLTGSGTIAAPAQSIVDGVTITWSQTAMPQASVRDAAGAGSPGGAVGGFNAKAGGSAGNGADVAIYWNTSALSTSGASAPEPVSVDILGSGSDGKSYSMAVALVFYGDHVQSDEDFPGWGRNDFRWSLEYGDILGTNPDGSPDGNPRTSIWLSPTFAKTLGGEQQRYTQNTNALIGQLSNTDTTTSHEKDAYDKTREDRSAAIGQPLEIGFGWRDKGGIINGPVLVDNFNFQGLLEYKLANVTVIDTRGFQILEMTYSPDDNKASFSWPSSAGQNFIIERSTDFIFWEELDDSYPAAAEPADTTTYEDNNLAGAGKMYYRVTLF